MSTLSFFANAKINLVLAILNKRLDGYHELSSLMQAITLHDVLDVKKIAHPTCELQCQFSGFPLDESNLIAKTYYLMKKKFGLIKGISVIIEKKIPIGGGLAGGSSNASTIIKAINQLFNLQLSFEAQKECAEAVGSDVAFTLMGGSAIATGRGEQLQSVMLPILYFVLVNPGLALFTADVYALYRHSLSSCREQALNWMQKLSLFPTQGLTPHEIAKNLFNDLESPAIMLFPEIQKIKEDISAAGALATLMSGSGSTCFGVFASQKEQEQGYDYLQRHTTGYSVFMTQSLMSSQSFM